MYVEPITRQTFIYANQVPCENNPQNVIALELDTDQNYVLAPQTLKKDPSLLYEPTQIQTAISPTTLLPKMQVFIPKKKSNFFGIEFYLQNTPTILYNF